MKLEGKVAIVTAAGRGIGRAIAICLAEEGADVVVSSFREETTASTADAVKALGRKAVAMPGDITTADMITQVVQETLDTCGKIDIVVNNVGGGRATPKEPGSGPLAKIEADWDEAYEQNLRASVLMCEAVAPHFMEQQSGKIVNVSSIAGRMTPSAKNMTRFVPPSYCAIKAGLISYTQSLAERLGPYNINVNCVCPGIVYTDAWVGISKRMVDNIPEFQGQDSREWFVGIAQGKHPDMFRSTPLRREQTAEDLGHAVVYLVSEDAMNITGQTLNVDGGMVKS
jgi:NAD(P)-dependent dehydrogenase (short-subunit alcohol dehydrogenase family)